MEEFIKILSKPDNIPIAIMAPLVAFFVWLSISQGLRHDKLMKDVPPLPERGGGAVTGPARCIRRRRTLLACRHFL